MLSQTTAETYCNNALNANTEWHHKQQLMMEQYDSYCVWWKQAMINWNSLFYCPRCDYVYNPITGDAAPTSSMQDIL
jgi:hypothetical protein